MKNNKNPKKYVFNIFAMFLAFSTSFKKNFNFQLFFFERVRLFTRHFKIIIFLIELMLILLIFKNTRKKQEKSKFTKKKKVEGPILIPGQHFTYKYRLKTQRKGGGSFL